MSPAAARRDPSHRPARLAGAAATGVCLYAVFLVHAAGQALLALTLLLITALALWTYTSARTNALRYLFPGVAAAALFVIFPMLYTVGIGFTNYSSQNLLDFEATRAYLLDEAVPAPDSAMAFTLHAEGGRLLRLRLESAGGTWVSAPLTLNNPPPGTARTEVAMQAADAASLDAALPLRAVVPRIEALRGIVLTTPRGARLTLISLREFAQMQPLYLADANGALVDRLTKARYRPDQRHGFLASPRAPPSCRATG